MFDVGFSELLVIAVVALLVLGPERLPKAARFAGLWVRRARAQWHSVRAELERDLAAEDLQRSLRDAGAAMRDAQAALRAETDGLMRGPAPATPPAPPTPPPRPDAERDDG
jgi:sec-independent protein translocase protein TatB